MIGFAYPAWLFGLLLAPLIWYLHRRGPLLRRVPVPSIDLWRDAGASAMRSGRQPRPDPVWWRRAAIAALLSLALAGPHWTKSAPRVTVWIDDSLSMQAADSPGTRLQRGIAMARRALDDAEARDVIVRRLSQPGRPLDGLGQASASELLDPAGGIGEPRLPPPGVLDASRQHWLVTDGADASVNVWAQSAALARVLQVSDTARNVGITRVSVRPQPTDHAALAVQVRVLNGGTTREARTVELLAGADRLATRAVELDGGADASIGFSVPGGAPAITVRLQPGDALSDDDALAVDLRSLAPVSVGVDTACPASIRRAVHAHPALRLAAAGADQRLVFDCGGAVSSDGASRVVLSRGQSVAIDASRLLWSEAAGDLPRRLAGHLPAAVRGRLESARPGDIVLLAHPATPLIAVRQGAPGVVECALDLEASATAGDAGLPLLVAALADLALGEPLLDRQARIDRGDDASRVAALDSLAATSATPATAAQSAVTILRLLLLVLLLMAWDLLALLRRAVRDRQPVAPWQP